MRSWGNRVDTIVVDEPFYAHYLEHTGLEHPGREAVLAAHERDWRNVVTALLAPVADGVQILYQKQMSHHLLPHMGREWLGAMTHAFLIRDPAPMLASLGDKLAEFDIRATGLPQQVEIFDSVVRATGGIPAVVDAADLLAAPEPMLRALCAAVEVEFSPRMLSWPPGPRTTDGVWAKYWYERVECSTGFEPLVAEEPRTLTGRMTALERECRPLYEKLHRRRLRV
jgi:hypothetical protein